MTCVIDAEGRIKEYWGEVALVDLADYARGSIIRGGAAGWEDLVHPGTAYHLQTDATDVIWAQNLTMADGAWQGIGVALERIIYNAAGYVSVMGANLGVGTLAPAPVLGAIAVEILDAAGSEIILTRYDTGVGVGDFIGGLVFKNTDSSGTPPHEAGIKARAADVFGHMDLRFYAGRDEYAADTPQMVILGLPGATFGNAGFGTELPGARLEAYYESAVTAAPITVAILQAATSGMAANGFGAALDFMAEDDGGTHDLMLGGIAGVWVDAAAGVKHGALIFGTRDAAINDWGDAGFEKMRIDHLGNVIVLNDLVLPKTSGNGIKVDTTTPTFGWRDLLGQIRIRGVGANNPALATYIGNIKGLEFQVNDECWIEYHIPHDYVPGTDIHLHFHWSHNSADVTGGNVTWEADITYAKGHNQAAFPATVNPTVVGAASVVQYRQIITEVQISAAAPGATQIDSDDLEPDGVILARVYLGANNITAGDGVPDPFLHFADVHYQSTNIGTKDKVPDFYT